MSLDSFEKLIQSRIKKIQPRSRQRGYAKDLIEKMKPTIESALEKGCSYEEIADAISDQVKISPVTLKQYHQANKRKSHLDDSGVENQFLLSSFPEEKAESLDEAKRKIQSKPGSVPGDNTLNKLTTIARSEKEKSTVKEEKKQKLASPILTGASLTDEDYLEDFNVY